MVTPTPGLARKQLPTRIRAKKKVRDSLSARLTLADRITELPDIETAEERPGVLPHRVEVYLRRPSASIRGRREPLHLCTISRDGIAIFGLSDRDRYRVLSRGWGRLCRDGVNVFLPRDNEELEVCWNILERAYRSLYEFSATAVPTTVARSDGLPKFSRTTLQ